MLRQMSLLKLMGLVVLLTCPVSAEPEYPPLYYEKSPFGIFGKVPKGPTKFGDSTQKTLDQKVDEMTIQLFPYLQKMFKDFYLAQTLDKIGKSHKKANTFSSANILAKFNKPDECTASFAKDHDAMLKFAKLVRKKLKDYQFGYYELEALIFKLMPHNYTYLSEKCAEKPTVCDKDQKFQNIDGTCNNLLNPRFGAGPSALVNLIPARYGDDIDAPRTKSSVDGKPLPSPRSISKKMSLKVQKPEKSVSLMAMQYGQWTDHDLSLTAMHGEDGVGIDCSRCDSPQTVDGNCFPIEIPEDDDTFLAKNPFTMEPKCMDFVRSEAGEGHLQRKQCNELTSFLDASNVYGSNEETLRGLRAYKNGLMLTTITPDNQILMPLDDDNRDCRIPKEQQDMYGHRCFRVPNSFEAFIGKARQGKASIAGRKTPVSSIHKAPKQDSERPAALAGTDPETPRKTNPKPPKTP